nr:hypothetical protein [Tanacetum cinerariifolium]
MNEEDMFGVNDLDGDEEDASKQERIAEIDADEDLSLIDKTAQDQGSLNEEDTFSVDDLDGDEVIMDVTTGKNVEQDATVAKKEVSTADLVTTVGEVVTTAEGVKVTTAAITPQISKDELTLAHTLIEIKVAKPKARRAKLVGPRVLSLEQIKTNQAAKIEKLKKRVKKIKGKKKKRTHGLKRMYKERIAEIDADEDLSLIDKTAQDQGSLN